MSDPSGRRGVAPRTVATLVIAALVIAAGLAGAAVDRMLIRANERSAALPDTGFHPLSSVLRSPTNAERRKIRVQLARDLGLSATQAATIDSILDSRADEFRALREEIRPRVEQLTLSVRSDVERVLTETQRTRYRALLGTGGMTYDSVRASR